MTEARVSGQDETDDRDRALGKLRWLTALSGIVSLAVGVLATSAATRASMPTPPVRSPGPPRAVPPPGYLSPAQLSALNFSLPKPKTIVIWQTSGTAPGAGRLSGPAQAPAPGPAPLPAPPPAPPPVATTGTS